VDINRTWSTTPDGTSIYAIIAFFSVENAVLDALNANHTISGSIADTITKTEHKTDDNQALIIAK
jgi:hypothetical protein